MLQRLETCKQRDLVYPPFDPFYGIQPGDEAMTGFFRPFEQGFGESIGCFDLWILPIPESSSTPWGGSYVPTGWYCPHQVGVGTGSITSRQKDILQGTALPC